MTTLPPTGDSPSCGSDDPELARFRAGPAGGVDHARIERAVREILLAVGEDPDRPTWEAVVRLSGGTYQSVPPDSPALLAAIGRALP